MLLPVESSEILLAVMLPSPVPDVLMARPEVISTAPLAPEATIGAVFAITTEPAVAFRLTVPDPDVAEAVTSAFRLRVPGEVRVTEPPLIAPVFSTIEAFVAVNKNVPVEALAVEAPMLIVPPFVSDMLTLPLAALADTLAALRLRLPEAPIEPLLLVRLIVLAFRSEPTLAVSMPRSDIIFTVPPLVPTLTPRLNEPPDPVAVRLTMWPVIAALFPTTTLAVLSVKENVPLVVLAPDAPIVTGPAELSFTSTLPLAAFAVTPAALTSKLLLPPIEPLVDVTLTAPAVIIPCVPVVIAVPDAFVAVRLNVPVEIALLDARAEPTRLTLPLDASLRNTLPEDA